MNRDTPNDGAITQREFHAEEVASDAWVYLRRNVFLRVTWYDGDGAAGGNVHWLVAWR
jgi:hypothetical protein